MPEESYTDQYFADLPLSDKTPPLGVVASFISGALFGALVTMAAFYWSFETLTSRLSTF